MKQKTLDGVVKMAGREVMIKLLALGGGIVLARALEPAAFGLFAVATFVVSLFTMFSELGFGAALIRKPGTLHPEELNAFFTFQLALVSVLCVALVLLAPLAELVYKADGIAWVIRALSVSLFLTSLRSVPLIISERNLSYGPVAMSDVTGQVTYWLVAVPMALAGAGVWSLVAALIGSSAMGTVVLYIRCPWRPSKRFNWHLLRGNLRFGLMYQGQAVAHFVKDTMMPSLGGVAYGGVAVGYLSWAKQLAAFPLQLTSLVARVSYSALARLQDDKEAFGQMVESTLKWTARLTMPAFAVLAGLSPQIIHYVYGDKWLPSLPALYFLYATMIFSVGTGVLMPAVYSAGKAGTGLRISIAWAAGGWIIALVLIAAGAGFAGLAAAHALITGVALAVLVVEVRRLGNMSFLKAIALPVAGALAVAVACFVLSPALVHSLWSLLGLASIAGVVGLAINLWPDRRVVLDTAASMLGRAFQSHSRDMAKQQLEVKNL